MINGVSVASTEVPKCLCKFAKKKKALKWNQKFYEIISIILNSKPILLLKL